VFRALRRNGHYVEDYGKGATVQDRTASHCKVMRSSKLTALLLFIPLVSIYRIQLLLGSAEMM
jgi:hypothetical protein